MNSSILLHIAVVGFHHTRGPIVEYIYPAIDPVLVSSQGHNKLSDDLIELPFGWHHLPFYAIPDGAHTSEESWSGFHLPSLSSQSVGESGPTVFGVSCCRQIDSQTLENRTKDMTRNSVLKSIVLLSYKPIYLTIRDKLSVTSQAWFQLGDFQDYRVLRELYVNLSNSPSLLSSPSSQSITNYRDLIKTFGAATLTILKSWLLDVKVVVYAEKPTLLGEMAYSLAALIPGFLERLKDMPGLRAQLLTQTNEQVLQRKPLESTLEDIFPIPFMSQHSLFQPYFPLNDLDMLLCPTSFSRPEFYYTSFFIGTTNRMLAYHLNLKPDIIIDVELRSIEVLNIELTSILKFSERDRVWIDNLTAFFHSELETTVSDESVIEGYLFKEFRGYYISFLKTFESSLLSCTKDLTSSTDSGTEVLMKDYGPLWFRAWTRSYGFQAWNSQQICYSEQSGKKSRETFYSDWPSPIIFPGEESQGDEEDFDPDPDLDDDDNNNNNNDGFEVESRAIMNGLSETELAIRDAIRSPMIPLLEVQQFEANRLEDEPPYHPGYRMMAMKRVTKAKLRKGMAKKFIGSVSSYLWKKKISKKVENDKSIVVDAREIQVKVKMLEQPVLESVTDLGPESLDADSQISSDSESLEKRTRLLKSRLSSSWQHPILSHQPLLASYKDWNYWPARPRPAKMESNRYKENDGNK